MLLPEFLAFTLKQDLIFMQVDHCSAECHNPEMFPVPEAGFLFRNFLEASS